MQEKRSSLVVSHSTTASPEPGSHRQKNKTTSTHFDLSDPDRLRLIHASQTGSPRVRIPAEYSYYSFTFYCITFIQPQLRALSRNPVLFIAEGKSNFTRTMNLKQKLFHDLHESQDGF